MFRFGLRKSTATAAIESAGWLGAEWSSTRVRAILLAQGRSRSVQLDPPHDDAPLALTLDKRDPDTGYAALARCRLLPHAFCGNFLAQVGDPQEWRGERQAFSPDSAIRHLAGKLWPRLHRESDRCGLALPPYLQGAKVRLFHEALQDARWAVCGSISAPLALAGHRAKAVGLGSRGQDSAVLIVDADAHALSLSLVAIGKHETRQVATVALPKVSTRIWTERLIDSISDRCIRVSRRDPRDSAQAEQDLFLQLEPSLDRMRSGQPFALTIRSDHWYQDLSVAAEDVAAWMLPLQRAAVEGVQSFLLDAAIATPLQAIWLTESAGRLPGLAAALYRLCPERAKVILLPAGAAADATAALVPRWLSGRLHRMHIDAVLPHDQPLPSPELPPAIAGSKPPRAVLPTPRKD